MTSTQENFHIIANLYSSIIDSLFGITSNILGVFFFKFNLQYVNVYGFLYALCTESNAWWQLGAQLRKIKTAMTESR